MVLIEGEIVINRPVEEVLDFVADERNEPRYNPHMRRAEQLSDGPIGVGTRFRAEIASMGRTLEMAIEFTGYERPRRLASSTHMSSMDTRGALTFDPVPEGARMRWSWDVEPRGMSGRWARWSPAWAGARSGGSGQASSTSWWQGRGPTREPAHAVDGSRAPAGARMLLDQQETRGKGATRCRSR
jgi:hypothetical protein